MPELPYDKTDANSIEEYAKLLIGKTFKEILFENVHLFSPEKSIEEVEQEYENANNRGGLGNFLEKYYFLYDVNNRPEADFPEAGLELKTTPYEKKSNGKYSAAERLSLGMISYTDEMPEKLEESHIWEKCKLILLIYYLRNRDVDRLSQQINFVWNFTPSDIDLEIIRQDYKTIAGKVRSGNAHEISESDTMYLGASTKGSTAIQSTIPQERYNPNVLARKRSFCFKQPYMTQILNRHISEEEEEKVITNINELNEKTFEEILEERIKQFVGKTDKQICQELGISYDLKNKGLWARIGYRMLGVHSNRAEELEKANIKIKSLRIEENGTIREKMSFPVFKYKELARESWEDSTLNNYFTSTKFLFVVYKKQGENYTLKGSQLWNMPYSDLNDIVRPGWEKIVDIINEGVELSIKKLKGKVIVENNFPSIRNNEIIHVRPHASKRYYKLEKGQIIGNGLESDANELPDGRMMVNYCFWINNSYIKKQLRTSLIS